MRRGHDAVAGKLQHATSAAEKLAAALNEVDIATTDGISAEAAINLADRLMNDGRLGLAQKRKQGKKAATSSASDGMSQAPSQQQPFRRFLGPDGLQILVGRNRREN